MNYLPGRNRVSLRRISALVMALLFALMALGSAAALAEETGGNRWGEAADEIDKYLDAAFECYLDGDT